MIIAIKRGDHVTVNMTATFGDGEPRDLTDTLVEAAARFDGSNARVVGSISVTNAALGKFDVSFRSPSHRVGMLLLDTQYTEGGITNSSPTIELSVIQSGVEKRIDRILTQYRESPNLIHTIRTILDPLDDLSESIKVYPDFFHLETAVGPQLTMIGLRLGWPRCHCICTTFPVFGFDCESDIDIAGFCEPNSSWSGCMEAGIEEFCISDDETYRTFLKVRIYQTLGLFDLTTLERSIRMIWPNAWVPAARNQSVIIAPNSEDLDILDPLLQLWPRVLPVAVGVRTLYHFGTRPIFGFGEGWRGLTDCSESPATTNVADWLCQIDPSPC